MSRQVCPNCDKGMMQVGEYSIYVCDDCSIAVSYEECHKCGGKTAFDLMSGKLVCSDCNVSSTIIEKKDSGSLATQVFEFASDVDSDTNPSYYANNVIEPIVYIMANKLGFAEGNVVKYVTRWKNKNGVEDLKKARQYIDFLINQEEIGSPK